MVVEWEGGSGVGYGSEFIMLVGRERRTRRVGQFRVGWWLTWLLEVVWLGLLEMGF